MFCLKKPFWLRRELVEQIIKIRNLAFDELERELPLYYTDFNEKHIIDVHIGELEREDDMLLLFIEMSSSSRFSELSKKPRFMKYIIQDNGSRRCINAKFVVYGNGKRSTISTSSAQASIPNVEKNPG